MKCSDFTLLFADDEPGIRSLYQKAFVRDGFKIILCEDAHQVLDKVKQEKVDLAVLDLQMPGMDGMDIFAILKKDYPAIQIMVVSGQFKGLVDNFTAKGYDSTTFFNKPVSLNALKQSLFKILKIDAMGSFLVEEDLG